jgi:hypothetical protein
LILEVGLGTGVLDTPFSSFGYLATSSLVKSAWSFLSQYDLQLKHDIVLPSFRESDTPIMTFFILWECQLRLYFAPRSAAYFYKCIAFLSSPVLCIKIVNLE